MCLRAPSHASEPWWMAKPHRGAPSALSWAPYRPEPQPNCPVSLWAPPPRRGLPASASAKGAPAVLPRARLRSTKATRPPKCECRSLRAGGGPAGAARCMSPPASPPSSSQSPRVHKGKLGRRKGSKTKPRSCSGSGEPPALGFLLALSFQALLTSPGPGPPHPAPAVLAAPSPRAGPAVSPAVVPDHADEKARALGAPRAGGLPGGSLPDGAPRAGARFRSRGPLA